ncbi:MAG: hypothetical protein ACYC6Y_18940, partial [Thermoguttaceae bacterium]
GASVRVSDERALGGRQSVKVSDSKALTPNWQPHFYYEPHFTAGTIHQSFDVWMARDAQFFAEWRDAGPYPQNVGPSVQFDGDGTVRVAGKKMVEFPPETWVHVEIRVALGDKQPKTFTLVLTPENRPPQTFADLPVSGSAFRQLHWLGFSSTAAANTVFYVDNLAFSQQ